MNTSISGWILCVEMISSLRSASLSKKKLNELLWFLYLLQCHCPGRFRWMFNCTEWELLVMGEWLDWVILWVFSNLGDSGTLWLYECIQMDAKELVCSGWLILLLVSYMHILMLTDLQFDLPVRELSSLFFLPHLTAVESSLCVVRL